MQYPLVYMGKITGNLSRLDINPGYYAIDAASTISGAPEGTSYTGFIQLPVAAYRTQIILGFADNGIKVRQYVGNPAAWFSWK